LNNPAGLNALIPVSDDFLNRAWPHTPYVRHGALDAVKSITELPFLQSVEAMLNSWPGLVQAHLPEVADESLSVDATPQDARKLYASKMALLFNQVQKISPVLTKWLETLRADLGLPSSAFARCMVYATPDGKGTAPHFDQNVNFVLQLRGTKTWWLAPNTSVVNPTQRFTIGQPCDPELASYLEEELPKNMPEGEKVVLEPGSLLFVPRGFWHRTEASGEALALNFTFSQPTWVDIFTLALRSRLLLSPAWRELADGASSQDPERREVATHKLDLLLMELTHDLPNWQASDILGATEGF
jgi:50S ribosomal protein L16 3-hydroxylase